MTHKQVEPVGGTLLQVVLADVDVPSSPTRIYHHHHRHHDLLNVGHF